MQGIVFVNEYALVRTLGKGSFGKVKLGLNTRDHELYALKLIPKSRKRLRGVATDAPHVAEAEVMQEINVMKDLDHPNIVKLVEVIGMPHVFCRLTSRPVHWVLAMLSQIRLQGIIGCCHIVKQDLQAVPMTMAILSFKVAHNSAVENLSSSNTAS